MVPNCCPEKVLKLFQTTELSYCGTPVLKSEVDPRDKEPPFYCDGESSHGKISVRKEFVVEDTICQVQDCKHSNQENRAR